MSTATDWLPEAHETRYHLAVRTWNNILSATPDNQHTNVSLCVQFNISLTD
jgi:hypothetical protein